MVNVNTREEERIIQSHWGAVEFTTCLSHEVASMASNIHSVYKQIKLKIDM